MFEKKTVKSILQNILRLHFEVPCGLSVRNLKRVLGSTNDPQYVFPCSGKNGGEK